MSLFTAATPSSFIATRTKSMRFMLRSCRATFNAVKNTTFAPCSERMQAAMGRRIGQFKILNAVVLFVAILMVNLLIIRQISSQMLSHNQSVLKCIGVIVPDEDVASRMQSNASYPCRIAVTRKTFAKSLGAAFNRTVSPSHVAFGDGNFLIANTTADDLSRWWSAHFPTVSSQRFSPKTSTTRCASFFEVVAYCNDLVATETSASPQALCVLINAGETNDNQSSVGLSTEIQNFHASIISTIGGGA